jgi:uncharacterized membrane protein
MDWFYLALLSALSLAFADVFSKKYFAGNTGLELLLVRFFVPGFLLLPVTLTGNYPEIYSAFWLWIAILVPLELLAMMLYSLAIRDCPLYLTLPYLAFTPVFNVFTAKIILGETVTQQNLAGILLVVFGAYLLNVRKPADGQNYSFFGPLKAIVTERGSRLMLIAAIVYSITGAMGKGAMQYVNPETFGSFYFTVIGFTTLLLVLVLKPDSTKVIIKKPGYGLLVGICMAIMVICHFLSIAQIEVAYMVAVKRTSLLFGIILGAIFFSEKHLSQHFLAGMLMVIGVTVILI